MQLDVIFLSLKSDLKQGSDIVPMQASDPDMRSYYQVEGVIFLSLMEFHRFMATRACHKWSRHQQECVDINARVFMCVHKYESRRVPVRVVLLCTFSILRSPSNPSNDQEIVCGARHNLCVLKT